MHSRATLTVSFLSSYCSSAYRPTMHLLVPTLSRKYMCFCAQNSFSPPSNAGTPAPHAVIRGCACCCNNYAIQKRQMPMPDNAITEVARNLTFHGELDLQTLVSENGKRIDNSIFSGPLFDLTTVGNLSPHPGNA